MHYPYLSWVTSQLPSKCYATDFFECWKNHCVASHCKLLFHSVWFEIRWLQIQGFFFYLRLFKHNMFKQAGVLQTLLQHLSCKAVIKYIVHTDLLCIMCYCVYRILFNSPLYNNIIHCGQLKFTMPLQSV